MQSTPTSEIELSGARGKSWRRAIIRVTRGCRYIVAATCFTALLGIGPQAVLASTSNTSATITAYGSCTPTLNSMTMSGRVQLSARFPNGAYVSTRYAYYFVDTLGRITSGPYTTAWLAATWVGPSTTTVWRNLGWGPEPVTITNQSYLLPTYTFSARGHLVSQVQVGVWNGTAYEYSSWDRAPTYDNYLQGGMLTASSCWAS